MLNERNVLVRECNQPGVHAGDERRRRLWWGELACTVEKCSWSEMTYWKCYGRVITTCLLGGTRGDGEGSVGKGRGKN